MPEPTVEAAPAPPGERVEVIVAPALGQVFVDGARKDYYRYQRTPDGLFIGLLQAIRRVPAGYAIQEFWWRNLGVSDQKGFLEHHNRDLPTYLRFWRTTAEFYGDPLAPGRAFSERADTRLRYHYERLDPSSAVDVYVWDQRVQVPSIRRELPFTGIDYRSPEVGLRGMLMVKAPERPAGERPTPPAPPEPETPATPEPMPLPEPGAPPPGAPMPEPGAETAAEPPAPVVRKPYWSPGKQLYLEGSARIFDNETVRLPDSTTQRLLADYVQPLSSRTDLSIEGEVVVTGVEQRGSASSRSVRILANTRPSDRVAVESFFRHREVELPFTMTSYARRRSVAGVNVAAFPHTGVRLRGGLFYEHVDRQVDALDRESLGELAEEAEEAAWVGGWARTSFSGDGGWLAQLGYLERRMTDSPPAVIPGLPSRETLYYTGERQVNLRVERPVGLDAQLYLMYLWRHLENDPRDTTLSLNSATLGATAQLCPRLSATGELTAQMWNGVRRPFRVPGGSSTLVPRFFFSSGGVVTASASYELSGRSSLEASYNYGLSWGGQDGGDHLGILRFRQELTKEFFYSVGLQVDGFRDHRHDRAFTAVAPLFQVGWRHQFDLPAREPRAGSTTPETPAPGETGGGDPPPASES